MPAYVIVQVEITDGNKFGNYLEETPRTIAAAGSITVIDGYAPEENG